MPRKMHQTGVSRCPQAMGDPLQSSLPKKLSVSSGIYFMLHTLSISSSPEHVGL